MNNVVIARVEVVVRSITGLSGNGPNGIVQIPDRKDFTGNTEKTPFRSASSQLDLYFEQGEKDETRDFEKSENGDVPPTRLFYDCRAHAHDMVTRHNTPHNNLPEYITGRTQTHKNPLLQQFTEPQNLTTDISPKNTLPMVERKPKRQNSDSGNTNNKLAEAIAGIASQQRPQMLSALFKPTTTNKLLSTEKMKVSNWSKMSSILSSQCNRKIRSD